MSKSMVHLIDDHDAFRESTLWLLEAADFLVTDYASALDFLERVDIAASGQACILSDVRMPQMTGLELLTELKKRQITWPLILITGHGDVPLAVEAMRMGAHHFLEKPFSETAIVGAIHSAIDAATHAPKTNVITDEQAAATAESNKALQSLSTRERQVFDLVVRGKSNKEIGREIFVSVKTVELYRARMMSKLSVKTLPDLMRTYLSLVQL
jgi:two-component system, LuxR family, response regulator FixJ